jgi:[glutamine synthetase] adenylyltransferase / [glutamine synthetase]-adenylyl-L-tyrosine phosphorylase
VPWYVWGPPLILRAIQMGLEQTESLISELPEQDGPGLFYERVKREHPKVVRLFERETGLLADCLALVSWSPYLGDILLNNPSYFTWLSRERLNPRVKTLEELLESLGRFALTNSSKDPQQLIADFRRRLLLRTYLFDVRGTSTTVETTEELSFVADSILHHALGLAYQDLANQYGNPLRIDEKGREAVSSFCVVALGKLGSKELNYASDIDLMFLYSEDGGTSGAGTKGAITNKEFFNKLSGAVAQLVGDPGGAYRVDLRLRPYGRVGPLCCSVAEAVRYYKEVAQTWELQTLIRSRVSAGSYSLFLRFIEQLRNYIYRPDVTVTTALEDVRLAKEKIDDQHGSRTKGFNVKLGKGGIREIEFIAQALQLAYGGQDPWLRVSHTLVSLERLAERTYISERERSELTDSYVFLRTLEHRLQMENGLQTHTVPEDKARREVLARRMHFTGPDALSKFETSLDRYTKNVSSAFSRIFGSDYTESKRRAPQPIVEAQPETTRLWVVTPHAPEKIALHSAVSIFSKYLALDENQTVELEEKLVQFAALSLNAKRSLLNCARIASSLSKSNETVELSDHVLERLMQVAGGSEYLTDLLISTPSSISTLSREVENDFEQQLIDAVSEEQSFNSELAILRSIWRDLVLQIGTKDLLREYSVTESNRLQTRLATASIKAAILSATKEISRRYNTYISELPVVVFGLGRLGSSGIDYGSDLDLVLVHDDFTSPVSDLSTAELISRFSEFLVAALSSITREGSLYRVDLRLRPYGRNGPSVSTRRAFVEYLEKEAAIWECLAYVKIRAVAGPDQLREEIEREARSAIHTSARTRLNAELAMETRKIRDRLQDEKTKGARGSRDIKFGSGGMLDVYFSVRYLQLKHNQPDKGEDRSTKTTLSMLFQAGHLDQQSYEAFSDGYRFLRELDHQLRLLLGRSTRMPAADHPDLEDLAKALNFESPATLVESLERRMESIRMAYDRVTRE